MKKKLYDALCFRCGGKGEIQDPLGRLETCYVCLGKCRIEVWSDPARAFPHFEQGA